MKVMRAKDGREEASREGLVEDEEKVKQGEPRNGG